MAESLQELERRLAEARASREELGATAESMIEHEDALHALDDEIHGLEREISRLETRQRAASTEATEKAKKDVHDQEVRRIGRGLTGCGVPLLVAAVAAVVAVALGMNFLGDDTEKKCPPAPVTTLGDLRVQLVADCEPETAPTATTPSAPSAQEPVKPAAEDLPAGQVLYEGTTGGQLGCIACDGQSRFIDIEDSTTGLGDPARAGQEIVWPENGEVVDFGVRIPRPNKGRYGINLFVNGAYSVGCPIETGSSACRVLAGQDPSPVAAGDRVTIIVGEAGTVDDDGVPVEEGDFVLEWWFVFQPG